jgi:hypothetical protein
MGGLETSGVIPIITAMRSQGPLVERNSRLPPLESCIHQLNTSLEQINRLGPFYMSVLMHSHCLC